MKKGIKKILLSLLLIPVLISAQELFIYNLSNSPLIPSASSSIAVDSSNNIWIGNDTILYKFKDKSWLPQLTSPKPFVDLEVTPNGIVFTITHKEINVSTILHNKNNEWNRIEKNINQMFKDPVSISIKNDTTIYFPLVNSWPNQLGADKIGIFRGNDSIEVLTPMTTLVEGNDTSIVGIFGTHSLATLNGDSLLITDWEGIHLFDGNKWILKNPEEGYPTDWGFGYFETFAKSVRNRTLIAGKRLFEFKESSYLSYPQIDSILSTDSSRITCINIEKNNTLWIGTSNGKLLQYLDSVTVYEISSSLIRDIAIDMDGNKWLISKEGCFVFNENKIVDVKERKTIPKSFELFQNYPNPFNPSTVIKYSIPTNVSRESAIVSLRIYDILGRVVATLSNSQQSAGKYEITFDATDMTTGIYFYQLNISSNSTILFSQTKKMLLIK